MNQRKPPLLSFSRISLAVAGSLALLATASTPRAQDLSPGENPRPTIVKKAPPAPPLNIAGSWSGTIDDSVQGSGSISLTFTQTSSKTKGKLGGSWSVSFPSTAPAGAYNDVGDQTGSDTATTASMTLKPGADNKFPCSFVFKNIQATAEEISGAYKMSGKCKAMTGTITVQPVAQNPNPAVKVEDDTFAPLNLVISAGQTVTWTNFGGEAHTVNANPGTERCSPTSSELFNSETLNPSDTFQQSFPTPGTYAYHCEIHGCMMKGTITVQ
jgi:plastocyanin